MSDGGELPGGWLPPSSRPPERQPEEPSGPLLPEKPGEPIFEQRSGWQAPPPSAGETKASGSATAALVLGILGVVICPFVGPVLALVYGYRARREIAASGGRLRGGGNATAGIVLGWVGLAFSVLMVVLILVGAWSLDTDSSDQDSPFVSLLIAPFA